MLSQWLVKTICSFLKNQVNRSPTLFCIITSLHDPTTEVTGSHNTFQMATDWGIGGLATFVQTSHADVYPAIDPTTAKLPQPSVVCVVGASRGIGAGIAKAYAKASATGLVLASRRISDLEATAASCKKLNLNINIEIVECDITSASSVSALAEKIKARIGRLDVVVVNSGASGAIVAQVDGAHTRTVP